MNSPVSPPLSPPTPTDVDETRDLLAHSQRLREMLAQTHTRIRTLEDQLRNSEALASFGHFKISTESKFSLSRSAAQLLGLNAPEAPKKLDEAFRFAAPEDRTALLAECVKLTSGGAPVDMEAMFELGNAGRRWLRVVLRRSTTPQGTEYYGLIIDVTQSRLDAIRRELALEISRKLLSDEDSTGAYESVLLRVCNGLGWDVGSLWLAEADGSLACIAVASLDDPQLDAIVLAQRNRHLRKGSGMVGEVWKTCESAWAESVPEDHRFADREAAIKSGINSAYTFPIVLDQGSSAAKPIGVLQFLSRAGRRYDAQLPAMSGLIGAMLAQRVRRERWVSRIRDVAEKDALTGFASRFALVEHLWTRTAI
jgi:hypothetical protein